MFIKLFSITLTSIIFPCGYGKGVGGSCSSKEISGCCTNFYWNGTVCVACSDGYIGENCSTSCPTKRYGAGCIKKCNCPNSLCHNVYGCKFTTECLDGYVGENCSSACPAKRYGANCSKSCDCPKSSCHHVYGCTFTTDCPAGFLGENCSASCPYPRYGVLCNETCGCSKSLCHHAYGCKLIMFTTTAFIKKSQEKNRERKLENKSYSKYRIMIIMSGTIVSISLLFLIGRQIYQFLGITQVNGDHPTQGDVPNGDTVYAVIS